MNRRAIGEKREQQAKEYLQQQGYRILETNFYCRLGEIDLIAAKEDYLVFVEVKYRKNLHQGSPLEAVDYRKQRKMIKTAMYYIMMQGYQADIPCRFDVVAITGEQIEHLENAFGV